MSAAKCQPLSEDTADPGLRPPWPAPALITPQSPMTRHSPALRCSVSRDPKSIAAVTNVPSSPPPPPCRPLSLLTRQPPPPQGPPPCIPLPVNSLASSPSWPTALIPLAVSTLTTPRSPRKGPPARAGQRSTEQRKRGGSHQMQRARLTANPAPVSLQKDAHRWSAQRASLHPCGGGFANKAPHPLPPPVAHRRRPALTFGTAPRGTICPPSARAPLGGTACRSFRPAPQGGPRYLPPHPLLCVCVLG